MKVNNLDDKRQAWKVKHNLVDILVIVMLAILTGHNDFEEMIIFAEARIDILRGDYGILDFGECKKMCDLVAKFYRCDDFLIDAIDVKKVRERLDG